MVLNHVRRTRRRLRLILRFLPCVNLPLLFEILPDLRPGRLRIRNRLVILGGVRSLLLSAPRHHPIDHHDEESQDYDKQHPPHGRIQMLSVRGPEAQLQRLLTARWALALYLRRQHNLFAHIPIDFDFVRHHFTSMRSVGVCGVSASLRSISTNS